MKKCACLCRLNKNHVCVCVLTTHVSVFQLHFFQIQYSFLINVCLYVSRKASQRTKVNKFVDNCNLVPMHVQYLYVLPLSSQSLDLCLVPANLQPYGMPNNDDGDDDIWICSYALAGCWDRGTKVERDALNCYNGEFI